MARKDLRATRADEAGDAKDLAFMERERHAGHPAGGGKIFDPQQFGVPVPRVVARRGRFDLAEHRGYQGLLGPLRSGPRFQQPAVAHYRDAVAQPQYFVEVM